MTNVPSNLKYTKDHEWTRIDGDTATIGITDFAQEQLGDIVFVELPEAGTTIELGTAFGVIESIKSVSDLYAPVSGEVIEANSHLEDQPELLNSDPYENWIIKMKMSDTNEAEKLLLAEDYKKVCTEIK